MDKPVSTRLDRDQLAALDALAKELGLKRADLLRRVVAEGIVEVRMDAALDAYSKGDASLGRAAEIAGRPVPDVLDEMARRGMSLHYGRRELHEDMAWATS